jgi:hypothetical protein
MMKVGPKILLTIFGALVSTSPCLGQEGEKVDCSLSPKEIIEAPFSTLESRERFRDYVARLSAAYQKPITIPDTFWEVAPSMTVWGYQLEMKGSECLVHHIQTYNIKDVVSRIVNTIGSLRSDGCSYFSTRNARAGLSEKEISFYADLKGKVRSCGDWPWGGSWATDIGDISGSASGSVSFRTEPTVNTGRINGKITSNDPVVSIDVDLESIFGINANSVVGSLLKALMTLGQSPIVFDPSLADKAAWLALNGYNDAYRVHSTTPLDANFVDSVQGKISIPEYLDFLQQIKSFSWSYQPFFMINDSLTKYNGDVKSPSIDVVFTAPIKNGVSPETVWADVITEIKLLESFKKGPTTISAKRGDSWWLLALNEYGTGFYFPMLAFANGASVNDKIQIGQNITVPPLDKLWPVAGAHFARPGDTVYGLCEKWLPIDVQKCEREVAKLNPDIVKLDRIFALQGFRMPDSAASQ